MPGVMAAPAVVCVKRALPAVCMLGLVSVPHRHRNPRWPLADCPQELGLAQISGWQDAGYLGFGTDRSDIRRRRLFMPPDIRLLEFIQIMGLASARYLMDVETDIRVIGGRYLGHGARYLLVD